MEKEEPVRTVRLSQAITRPPHHDKALWGSIGVLSIFMCILRSKVTTGASRNMSDDECHRDLYTSPMKTQAQASESVRRRLFWKSVVLVLALALMAFVSFGLGPEVGTVIGGAFVAGSALINIQRRMWEEKGYEPKPESEENMRAFAGVGASFLLGAAVAVLLGWHGIVLPIFWEVVEFLGW